MNMGTVGYIARSVPPFIKNGGNFGRCSICEGSSFFARLGTWLRDNYRCVRCNSIPRQRALFVVLEEYFPNWRDLQIHESSPSSCASFRKFSNECPQYTPSQYFLDIEPGSVHRGFRREDLGNQSFDDEELDLVVTQDVLEHLLEPLDAFKEIHRTLLACPPKTVPDDLRVRPTTGLVRWPG
jgi:hypothetical protein